MPAQERALCSRHPMGSTGGMACGAARLSNATRRSDTRRHRCLRRWRLQPARVLPAPSSSSCVTGTTAWCRGRWWSGSKVRRVGGSRRQVASSTSCLQTRPQRMKSSSRALFFTCRESSRHPASAMAELVWSRVHCVWASATTNCHASVVPLPGMARCTIVLPLASRPRNTELHLKGRSTLPVAPAPGRPRRPRA